MRRQMMRTAVAVLAGSLAAAGVHAASARFDFTGHWSGSAAEKGQPATALTADFAATGPKTFAGMLLAGEPCAVTGTARQHLKVAVRAACGSGRILKMRGRLQPATQTIAGTFVDLR